MEGLKEISVIIAEDEPAIRRKIINILKSVEKIKVIGEVDNGARLVEQCLLEEPDAILVDIGMPEMNGMEAVHSIREDLPDLFVIFITAFTDYALEAFEVSAVDYVMKPIKEKRLLKAISRLRQYLAERVAFQAKEVAEKEIVIKNGEDINVINQDQILMVEKEDKNLLIHTRKEVFKIKGTLSSFKNKLNNSFLQTHRSFMVNLNEVEKVISAGDRTCMVEFKNYKEKAYVSRTYLQQLYDKLQLY